MLIGEDLVGGGAVGRGGADRDVVAGAAASRSMRAGHGHDAGVGVDGKPPAGVVRQAVGDRVGRGVGVAGRGVMPTRGAVGRVLVDRVGRGVACPLTAPTSNSSTSLMVMVKTWSVNEPSAEVARTVMLRLAPSASRSIAPATVTTPVLASMANRPPSLSLRL